MLAVDLRHLQNWAALEIPRIELGQCIWHSLKCDAGRGWLEEQLLSGGVCKCFTEKTWNSSEEAMVSVKETKWIRK